MASMSESDQPYRPGRIIAGRYRVTSPLSKGGMGAVYLAQQVSLGRDVALKVILDAGTDPELIARFDVEARAVCQLKHPNIITYHDYGRDDEGHPFLVMEFLAGYAGTRLVYGERRPGLAELVHVIAQVCSALHEAHAKRIIHRDLKWSNVMICPRSHDPLFTKLIDFGILKVATDGSSGDQRALTRTGMLLGTPEYMSPEAICGMPIDGRADQYSLAIMLWEALEGHRPFDAPSRFELLRRQVQEEPPPFSRAAGLMQAHPELQGVILKALEKHPDDRFADIGEFQQALLMACGLATTSPSAPRMSGTQPRARAASTRSLDRRATSPNGMPLPRSQLAEEPRPIDTHVKTGNRVERRRPHWLLLAAAFVGFVGVGFAVVAALIDKEDRSTTAATTTPSEDVVLIASEEDTADERQATESVDVAIAAATEDTGPEPDASRSEEARMVATADAVDAIEPGVAATDTEGGEEAAAEVVEPRKVTARRHIPKARAPVGSGRLFVQVDPWGNVAIDGRPRGRAPFDGELPSGVHSVTVTNTYFKGAHTFRVKVEAGKRSARTVILDEHLERIK